MAKLLEFRQGATPEAVPGDAQPQGHALGAVTAFYRGHQKKKSTGKTDISIAYFRITVNSEASGQRTIREPPEKHTST